VRRAKIRVYEMVDDPVAREMVGYLLVRGGTHIVAYARALEELSGVPVGKLLPIPDISNKRFPEAMKHEAKGLHQVMYRMSLDDYREITQIWRGLRPEDGSPLRVVDGRRRVDTCRFTQKSPSSRRPSALTVSTRARRRMSRAGCLERSRSRAESRRSRNDTTRGRRAGRCGGVLPG
jgi:Mn-containing catalase